MYNVYAVRNGLIQKIGSFKTRKEALRFAKQAQEKTERNPFGNPFNPNMEFYTDVKVLHMFEKGDNND